MEQWLAYWITMDRFLEQKIHLLLDFLFSETSYSSGDGECFSNERTMTESRQNPEKDNRCQLLRMLSEIIMIDNNTGSEKVLNYFSFILFFFFLCNFILQMVTYYGSSFKNIDAKHFFSKHLA